MQSVLPLALCGRACCNWLPEALWSDLKYFVHAVLRQKCSDVCCWDPIKSSVHHG